MLYTARAWLGEDSDIARYLDAMPGAHLIELHVCAVLRRHIATAPMCPFGASRAGGRSRTGRRPWDA